MLILIQCRLSSRRFKSKVLHKIQNLSMIEHVYKRVSKIKNKKKIVITTSTDVTDDRLCVFLKKKNRVL